MGPDDPKEHEVKKGETLWGISKKYGVRVDDLVKMNGIADPNKIYVGNTLKVNPEVDFKDNPYAGGYNNTNNSEGENVKMGHIANVGFGWAVGAGSENMIISGGGALESN